NYPNPFNPQTFIDYELVENIFVCLDIYNIDGQRVRTLLNGIQHSGFHQAVWDGRNDNGVDVASGLYLCMLKAGRNYKTIKLTLLR
ncbi:T9SS type A sorting domain-containing protein, partial [bacterium]|nr:T9SS type A sorting domain-containing protein [bacterium]